jgi:hypothetical protein
MEPKGSSPYTQEPATCPYPEPHQSSLRLKKALQIVNLCQVVSATAQSTLHRNPISWSDHGDQF